MRAFDPAPPCAPTHTLEADGTLRLPGRQTGTTGCLSPDGTTLSLDLGWGVIVVDLDAWQQRAVYRDDATTAVRSPLPQALCGARHPDAEHLVLLGPDGVRARLRVPANAAQGLTPMRVSAHPDALFLWGPRALTRWRCTQGALVLEATLAAPEREAPGYELREVVQSPDGARLYLRTDRDVLAVDALTLTAQRVMLDLDAYFEHPRAWLDTAQCVAVAAAETCVYVLLHLKKGWSSRLVACPLAGGDVRGLALGDGLLFHTMSPVLPGETMLLGGHFHGTARVDLRRLSVLEHAPGVGGSFAWVDVRRAQAWGFNRDGDFVCLDAAGPLRATTHPGARLRHHLGWNLRHLVALSRPGGAECFAPPASTPIHRALPEGASSARLSACGRWTLSLHAGRLTVQDLWDKHPAPSQPAPEGVTYTTAVAIARGGVPWWWDQRSLGNARGRCLAVSRRALWGALHASPSGAHLLLQLARELLVIDPEAGAIVCRWPAPKHADCAVTDAQTVVVVGHDGVRWYDGARGALLAWHKRRLPEGMLLAVDPRGDHVALARRGGTAVELIARAAPDQHATSVVAQGITAVAFSPDGSQLAVASLESPVRLFALDALLGVVALQEAPARRTRKEKP